MADRMERIRRFREIFGRSPPGVYFHERVPGEYDRLIDEALATGAMPQGLLDRYAYYEAKAAAAKRGVILD